MTATTTTTTCIELALRRIASTSLRLENVTELIAGVGGRKVERQSERESERALLHRVLACISTQHKRGRQAVQQQQQHSPHKTINIYKVRERMCANSSGCVCVCVCGGGEAVDFYSPCFPSFSHSAAATCKSAPERAGTHRERE